jgi:hypothetical protein
VPGCRRQELLQALALRLPQHLPGSPSSSTRPWCTKITWFDTSRAKPISCVTTIMVRPSSASERITLSTSPTSSGSSAEVGSSNSSTAGSIASARAIATRCCWPPDMCAG